MSPSRLRLHWVLTAVSLPESATRSQWQFSTTYWGVSPRGYQFLLFFRSQLSAPVGWLAGRVGRASRPERCTWSTRLYSIESLLVTSPCLWAMPSYPSPSRPQSDLYHRQPCGGR